MATRHPAQEGDRREEDGRDRDEARPQRKHHGEEGREPRAAAAIEAAMTL